MKTVIADMNKAVESPWGFLPDKSDLASKEWNVDLIGRFWTCLCDPSQFVIKHPEIKTVIHRVLRALDSEPYTASVVKFFETGERRPLTECKYPLFKIPLWLHSLLVAAEAIKEEQSSRKCEGPVQGSMFNVYLLISLAHDLGKLDRVMNKEIAASEFDKPLTKVVFSDIHGLYSAPAFDELIGSLLTRTSIEQSLRATMINAVKYHHYDDKELQYLLEENEVCYATLDLIYALKMYDATSRKQENKNCKKDIWLEERRKIRERINKRP